MRRLRTLLWVVAAVTPLAGLLIAAQLRLIDREQSPAAVQQWHTLPGDRFNCWLYSAPDSGMSWECVYQHTACWWAYEDGGRGEEKECTGSISVTVPRFKENHEPRKTPKPRR